VKVRVDTKNLDVCDGSVTQQIHAIVGGMILCKDTKGVDGIVTCTIIGGDQNDLLKLSKAGFTVEEVPRV
jgi:hypothetical protein